ncbi:hypothetical protein CspeluHIS016_0504400 [Cutaneotrichosporon spelunceum]|uniref:Uncharacterized protein n=1 Tax=Cutaneotrichosporon spelunceum TaxID=1672016 RepID=A0AAD3TWZ7_9TREE|nr:hypothetical protein CspeluHIS016_0504400 [Cutaneotrichosporon spelunceum]
MRASTAHSALHLLASLAALGAIGCNGYMLHHVQRGFASNSSPDYNHYRWRALLISAEAVCAAAALYALGHTIVRRINAYSPLVSVRVDVIMLLLLGSGAAAIGVLLFVSRVPGHDAFLYSVDHCTGLGKKRCGVHFAGGGALVLAALLLLLNAAFEAIYASRQPGGWGESMHELSSELGSDAPPKMKKSKSLSISAPLTGPKDSIDAPLMPPAPCATLPPLSYNAHGMELDQLGVVDSRPIQTPAPPSPARPESGLGPRFPKSKSTGSVGTVTSLATTPLFGLAPAYIPGQRTNSPSQRGTFGKANTNPYSTASSATPYADSSEESRYHTPVSPGSSASLVSPRENPYRDNAENPYTNEENPYWNTNSLQLPSVERPKLSLEQLDRKRTLFTNGML